MPATATRTRKAPATVPLTAVTFLGNGRFRVPSRSGGPDHEIDAEAGTCSCDRYTRGRSLCWAFHLVTVCAVCGSRLWAGYRYRRGGHDARIDCTNPDCTVGEWVKERWS